MKPVDDGPRQQLEVADPREDLRIDEPGAGDRVLIAMCHRRTAELR